MVSVKLCGKDVRFGSLAAATADGGGVRFTPESCRDNRRRPRPLWAVSSTGRRNTAPQGKKMELGR